MQSVQDSLDDPFDGISEDDVNLHAIFEWAPKAIWNTEAIQAGEIRGNPFRPRTPSRTLMACFASLLFTLFRGLLRETQQPISAKGDGATHRYPPGAVACCSRFLLTRALLMTSLHSKAKQCFATKNNTSFFGDTIFKRKTAPTKLRLTKTRHFDRKTKDKLKKMIISDAGDGSDGSSSSSSSTGRHDFDLESGVGRIHEENDQENVLLTTPDPHPTMQELTRRMTMDGVLLGAGAGVGEGVGVGAGVGAGAGVDEGGGHTAAAATRYVPTPLSGSPLRRGSTTIV